MRYGYYEQNSEIGAIEPSHFDLKLQAYKHINNEGYLKHVKKNIKDNVLEITKYKNKINQLENKKKNGSLTGEDEFTLQNAYERKTFYLNLNKKLAEHEQLLANVGDLAKVEENELRRNVLLVKGKDFDVNHIFPHISFVKNKESIAAEICDGRPFQSPEDLYVRIATYISDNMAYDFFTLLNDLGYDNQLLLSAQNPQKVILTNESINSALALKKQFPGFAYFFEYIENNKNDPHKIIKYTVDLIRIINQPEFYNGDKKELREKTREFLFGANGLASKISSSYFDNDQEVYDLLKTKKVGVCRNFSMIAKLVYNEVSKKYFPDSYCAYNVNFNHAYNSLSYLSPDGNLVTKRFDITAFNVGGSLEMNGNLEGKDYMVRNSNKKPANNSGSFA